MEKAKKNKKKIVVRHSWTTRRFLWLGVLGKVDGGENINFSLEILKISLRRRIREIL